MKQTFANQLRFLSSSLAIASLAAGGIARAGHLAEDFSTDPTSRLTIGGGNTEYYIGTGGNPGGFLALTYPIDSLKTTVVFPNLDPGKIVTAFSFSCDLRIGNSQGDRAADGFSISFAREGDPLLEDANSDQFGGNCCAETGTKTGIAVSFDTWSGNTFPNDPNDKTDIEGIIVRVDDVTVQKVSLPTRHGTADDITSLQTGPRDAAYWANGGDPKAPESWAGLAWRPFAIAMTKEGKLTVSWKGNKILDNFQTSYFPSAGALVFSGRTGGENEHTHVDNIVLDTTAEAVTAIPGAVGNFKAAVGARYVDLTWDAATVSGDPNARVAYEIERDGVVIVPLSTSLSYRDKAVNPNTSYSYKIRGKNIAGNPGPDASANAKTTGETDTVGFLSAEQWNGIGGTSVDAGTGDAHFGEAPDVVHYVNGFSFGETSNFGGTWGDNFITKISGVFTAPESGDFRFFVRSDDASALFINLAGAAIPDPLSETAIATETGCCAGFEEVRDPMPTETSEVITLTAGKSYGIAFLVKEGGGGDWGQVAIRKEGDLTPASSLPPLRGAYLKGRGDSAGASISITQQPAPASVGANDPVTFTAAATGASPYSADYGNAVQYTWYLGGVAQLNQNGASFSIPFANAADNGKKVWVVAAVEGASVKSDEVTLTVSPDTTAPTVKRINGSDTFDSATVLFSEPVVSPSATDASKYKLTGLTVSAATRIDAKTIKLTTSKQTPGATYAATVKGVVDNAGLVSDWSGNLTAFQAKSGIAVYSSWQGQTGGFATWVDNGVKDLPPTTSVLMSNFGGNDGDQWENYFGQIKGLFVAPANGDYVFFMASDDHGELYLSTDSDPANKKKIAEEPQWGARRYFIGNGTDNNSGTRGADGSLANRSDQYAGTEWPTGNTITLKKGSKYYLEVLYKEGGGGDNGSATYKLATEDDSVIVNGETRIKDALLEWYYDPSLQPPTVTKRPTTVKYNAGETITFTGEATSALPFTYQWYHNKHAIPGATSATLTIPNAGVGDIGDYYFTATNENGTTSSFPDDDARAIMKGVAMVVEAEDYNYDGGKTVAAASVNPLAADLYKGKDGLPGIDFQNNSPSGGGDGDNGNSLRNGWNDNGTVVASPAGAGGNLDVILDNGGNQDRPDFTIANNYKIGWGGTGNWFQYTRSFEPGTYSAVWVGSRDGRDADAFGRTLEIVTGDPTKADAATTVIGELTFSGTGGWSSNDSIPFMTPGGTTVAEFTLGANTTIRQRINKGDGDNDYLLFYKKAGSVAPPSITGITRNANGSITITWTGGGVLQASADFVNWQDIAGATSPYTFTPAANAPFLFGRIAIK